MQKEKSSSNRKDKPHGEALAEWTFPEYVQHERSKRWYVWAGVILALLLIYSIFTLNFLFAVIIILFVIILYAKAKNPPAEVKFKIFEDGIGIGSKFYKHKDVKNFWIIYEPPQVKTLYLNFKNKIRPVLAVPLEKQNPIRIRKILLDYVDEDLDKEEESFTEILGRRLKI